MVKTKRILNPSLSMHYKRTKAYYRHQQLRARAKAERLVREIWKYGPGDGTSESTIEMLIQAHEKNRKKCSCSICCTPRNNVWYKDHTRQERIDRFNVEEQIQEAA